MTNKRKRSCARTPPTPKLSIAVLYPTLCTEWHTNNEFGPECYGEHSIVNGILWQCSRQECRHVWKESIYCRILKACCQQCHNCLDIDKPYTCNICSETFKTSKALTEHVVCHSKDRLFVCTICNAKFKTKGALTKHIIRHSGDRPFVCGTCDATFKTNDALTKHIISHSEDRPFVCTICDATFKTNGVLTKHIIRHSEDRPFVCTICDATFKTKDALAQHSISHSEDRPFVCVTCDAPFKTSKALAQHMVSHSEDRPVVCTICNKPFKNNGYLVRHRRSVHQIDCFECIICLEKKAGSTTVPCRECRSLCSQESKEDIVLRFLQNHDDIRISSIDPLMRDSRVSCSSSKRRPDVLYRTSAETMTVFENDENYHRDRSPKCEVARQYEIQDSIHKSHGISNVVFVRINCDCDEFEEELDNAVSCVQDAFAKGDDWCIESPTLIKTFYFGYPQSRIDLLHKTEWEMVHSQ